MSLNLATPEASAFGSQASNNAQDRLEAPSPLLWGFNVVFGEFGLPAVQHLQSR